VAVASGLDRFSITLLASLMMIKEKEKKNKKA